MTGRPAHTIALIVAGGSGLRFGGELPKQYRVLCGEVVLRRSVRRFLSHPRIDGVRVVIHPDHAALFAAAVDGLALPDAIHGGDTRQMSVHRGLEALATGSAPPDHVLIHDAARPLVSDAVIDRVCDALDRADAAIPALPVADTLKRATADGQRIDATIPRLGLWAAQTPQGFRFARIVAAHRALVGEDLTDDAAVAERFGLEVALVQGDVENFKVTTADDLVRAERTLSAASEFRTGFGFDVHRFAPGDHVVLCGVAIAHDQGLDGHSDADVGLHALTDAILGTIGAGDIGTHFPPSDPQWRGKDSAHFLLHAADLLRRQGGRLINVDVTLICEAPRIGPHRPAMVARMGELLGLAPDRVSVKATTSERLGFTGRGEGIAAQAVATVRFA